MSRLKQSIIVATASLMSATVFIITLPLVLFVLSTVLLAGIAGAAVLSYRMRKMAANTTTRDPLIIDGEYSSR